jgi:hypothetical protein
MPNIDEVEDNCQLLASWGQWQVLIDELHKATNDQEEAYQVYVEADTSFREWCVESEHVGAELIAFRDPSLPSAFSYHQNADGNLTVTCNACKSEIEDTPLGIAEFFLTRADAVSAHLAGAQVNRALFDRFDELYPFQQIYNYRAAGLAVQRARNKVQDFQDNFLGKEGERIDRININSLIVGLVLRSKEDELQRQAEEHVGPSQQSQALPSHQPEGQDQHRRSERLAVRRRTG